MMIITAIIITEMISETILLKSRILINKDLLNNDPNIFRNVGCRNVHRSAESSRRASDETLELIFDFLICFFPLKNCRKFRLDMKPKP